MSLHSVRLLTASFHSFLLGLCDRIFPAETALFQSPPGPQLQLPLYAVDSRIFISAADIFLILDL